MTEEKEQYETRLTIEPGPPEAPASATVRYRLEGFDWMLTVRSFDETNPGKDLLTKQKAINAELKKMGADPVVNNYRSSPPPKPKAEDKPKEELPETKDCPIHPGMHLKLHRKGSQHWYSHKLDDGTWCKGE